MKLNKKKELVKITSLIEQIEELKDFSTKDESFTKWQYDVVFFLERVSSKKSKRPKQFESINFDPSVYLIGEDSTTDKINSYLSGLRESKAFLSAIKKEIEEYWNE